MMDTKNEKFLTELANHLEKRLDVLLSSILKQDIGPKATALERRAIQEYRNMVPMLRFLDGVEKSVETAGFLDRKAME